MFSTVGEIDHTYININYQVFAEHFDLELEVELEVGFLVQLGKNVHDAERPGVGRPEHLAVDAALHHLGNERHHVQQLLWAFVVRFV